MKTKEKQSVTADITALLRARNTLFWVVSVDEKRVEMCITDASAAAKFPVRFWDCDKGLQDGAGNVLDRAGDPVAALEWIRSRTDRAVYVLRDLHKWLDPVVVRKLRNLAREIQEAPIGEARAIVVLTPSSDVPPELANHATVIDYPIPDREEISTILRQAEKIGEGIPEIAANLALLVNGAREAAIEAAIGLSAEKAANSFARSLVQKKTIDSDLVRREKKRAISAMKGVEWYDPDPRGLDAIGGLDLLKGWVCTAGLAYSAKARAYGLPTPKGVLLVGVPGCGKSLTAKCIATAWGRILLRLDLGAVKGKYVGDSENAIRAVLDLAERLQAVLWIDELEKSTAGMSGAQGDGGVSSDQLGALLTAMQEREIFIVATVNDPTALPPELIRRFDRTFTVDLPTTTERGEILRAALGAHGRGALSVDVAEIARATATFTGAEIAALVPAAMFQAFGEGGREITSADLVNAASVTVPLAKTSADKIAKLRAWAEGGRAYPASRPEQVVGGPARMLDLG